MNKRQSPSIIRIAQVDYLAYLSFVIPVGVWILYLIFEVLFPPPGGQGPQTSFFYPIGLIVTPLGMIGLAWRYLAVRAHFLNGVEMQAHIEHIFIFRDQIRFNYSVIIDQQEVMGKYSAHKCRYTDVLEEGQMVTLLTEPNRPDHGMFADPFLEGEQEN